MTTDCYNFNLEILLQLLEPKIKKSLSQTSYQEREDLEQEIKLKMIEKYHNHKFNEAPKFWDLINA
ncbi:MULTISPECIES: hypothetical protein [Neobacillus]|jgi:hypothetical protein|uniref:hypothetical protein n=1 Tax=Neobacillus TaxID=2675232 RepID=UPI0004F78F29|nr:MULTISPECIES: hypothetical protein [Neobacillus]AIM16332.1 hypothetical protein HW35_08680 [Bacillus sp. X1(2014)]MED3625546.1 hypothetical protein [Neobacillus thermocopriae]MED3713391.1 hypothetical protein [Neobacillus thermocopriae]